MDQQPDVVLMAVYFGKLPPYFDMWLRSCAANSGFQFVVFSDAPPPQALPRNVRFIEYSLARFNKLFTQRFGVQTNVKAPYKVCDFRPAFWALLEEHEIQSVFWGHCDLDVVWGDLSSFVTPQMLRRYDRLFSLGHLSLYRNTTAVNNIFQSNTGHMRWDRVFSDERHYGFDEHRGVNIIWRGSSRPFYVNERVVADLNPGVDTIEIIPPNINFARQTFFWNGRQVRRLSRSLGFWRTDEFAYLHFQKRPFTAFPDCGSAYVRREGFKAFCDLTEVKEYVSSERPVRSLGGRARQWVRYAKRRVREETR